jgi:hypothetical protein
VTYGISVGAGRQVALVEDEEEDGEYAGDAGREILRRRHPVRDARRLDLGLRAGDPLPHGGLRHQEGAGDLGHGDRPHLDLSVAGPRSLGGELERHVEVGSLEDPEAGEILLRLQERPVGEYRLLAPVVDDGGRAGRREAGGEDPVTLLLEPVVERVDGRLLGRGGGAGLVVDHGNQVLHLGSSPVARGAPRTRPPRYFSFQHG